MLGGNLFQKKFNSIIFEFFRECPQQGWNRQYRGSPFKFRNFGVYGTVPVELWSD